MMWRQIFHANRVISEKIAAIFPHTRLDLSDEYEETVARHMNSATIELIADVGAGNQCHFAKYRREEGRPRIVGVDISLEAMLNNQDVDEKRVSDVVRQGLPFNENEVDLVVSRSVLEHLPDLLPFFESVERVLKAEGYSIHVFPSRFAPFAIVNRLLPTKLAHRLLYFVRPESVGVLGFPAYYDRCYMKGIRKVLDECGLELISARVSYYSSSYYDFAAPVFLMSCLYESLVSAADIQNLAAKLLIVTRKPPKPS